MDEEVTIYALRERDSDRVRYVGFSADPKKAVEALRLGRQGNANSYREVSIWLRAQRNIGKKPVIVELEKCRRKAARSKVYKHIEKLNPDLRMKDGPPLNVKVGIKGMGIVPVGGSVRLVRVVELAHKFNLSNIGALRLLEDLKVPAILIGDAKFFDMFALECAMHHAFMGEPLKTKVQEDPELGLIIQSLAATEYSLVEEASMKAKLKRWARKIVDGRDSAPTRLSTKT